MAKENSIKPRLGRIGNKGSGDGKRLTAQVRKIAARLAKPASRSRFTGQLIGRGSAAARVAAFRSHPFAKFRMRRVVVKTHIARASKGIGKAAFKAHLNYIQRDGVERDGSGGELYGRDDEKLDDRPFLARSEKDRHQFRIIVSPEDADRLGDLKENTRRFMTQMERDLGTKLDWVAVDHHNTGHPHTHIVIGGKDDQGKDLIIARNYITKGMRRLASELVTERFGPRKDMEIAQAQASEVSKERFTGIDRDIAERAIDGVVEIRNATGIHERFQRSLAIRRLRELERMRFAQSLGHLKWQLSDNWEGSLKRLGKRGDIIRSISQAMGADHQPAQIKIFDSTEPTQKPVLGRIAAIGPEDELRDTRFIVIEGLDGVHHHVSLGAYEPGTFPGIGAVVEVHANCAEPKQADLVIAEIAAANDGIYSDALHKAHDPSSTPAYREAHKRRLEALRRGGVTARNEDGTWTIDRDHLAKAARFEMARTGSAKLEVKSWLPIDQLATRNAMTWLDQEHHRRGIGAFANQVGNAREDRKAHLVETGILKSRASHLTKAQMHLLQARERNQAGKTEAGSSKRAYVFVEQGETFNGAYEKPVDLAQGRFAIVGNAREFTLVPWRPGIERHRGKPLTAKGTGTGIGWTPEKAKGIGR